MHGQSAKACVHHQTLRSHGNGGGRIDEGGDNVYQNLIIQPFAIPGKRSWPCVEIKGYNLLETFQFI